ncbi:glycoside hydrolase family 43 protein [Tuanshanicoccus lijuaniae]|uniref:glycoside hydrolase family 43 protein n=1 Tax=Aerococcaceae bacterium zg-1292 TaxID=2774330 RepID=UPI001BD853E9|nr:glycoside hydrolase family 43 protein [Aerococcaceae bacterium zg-A91]MBS4457147.1 glycoside hydrolase family 43 protein [Aerococcaceae bacterium zg-BR33]
MIKNPVLKGFNADPSMIRVNDTYYIATSTFDWFPGVQIHRSKNLIDWELITHPLQSVEQLNIRGNLDSAGVWAPDLSYSDGKFWLIYSDVKVMEGAFKDVTNYLITAEDIMGPWSKPIKLNGLGFDPSLFHDDDGRKYLVQMEWDHREYHHPFNGIKLTEYSVEEERLLPETAKIIWKGTDVKLVEGPHIYKLFGKYYLFCAEGGTVYTHQEVVARSESLYGPYEYQGEVFLGAYDAPNAPLQKCGHGSLVETQTGEFYFAHLTGRPWHHEYESVVDPRGWCTLGRETAIQKVEWKDGWPSIVGGKQGLVEVEAPDFWQGESQLVSNNQRSDFDTDELDINFNTLRVPFSQEIGEIVDGHLVLNGLGTLSNLHSTSLVARRWQAFSFDAETKVKYEPNTFQQLAGLSNFYNSRHWSMVAITWDEEKGKCIEVLEMNRGNLTSYLAKNKVEIPETVEYVYFKTKVRKQYYTYEYSFDGEDWHSTGVELDAKILSDDYVVMTQGGFFTGAFVGMVNIDYSGYNHKAYFDYFVYDELD